MNKLLYILIALLFIFISNKKLQAADFITLSSDIGQFFLLFYPLGTTWDDKEGAIMFLKHGTLSLGATAIAKGIVKERRPDGKSDDAFPSGHASAAFTGATFMHQRYGFKKAIPFYLGGVYVAFTRVQLKRHYTHDVLGSLALAYISSVLVVKQKNYSANLTIDYNRDNNNKSLLFKIYF